MVKENVLLPSDSGAGNERRPDFVAPLFVAHDKDTKLSGWEKTRAFFGLVLITTHHYLPVIAYNTVFEIKLFFLSLYPRQQIYLSTDSLAPPSAAVHSKSCTFFLYLFQRQCQVAMLLTLCGVNTQWSFKDLSFSSRRM